MIASPPASQFWFYFLQIIGLIFKWSEWMTKRRHTRPVKFQTNIMPCVICQSWPADAASGSRVVSFHGLWDSDPKGQEQPHSCHSSYRGGGFHMHNVFHTRKVGQLEQAGGFKRCQTPMVMHIVGLLTTSIAQCCNMVADYRDGVIQDCLSSSSFRKRNQHLAVCGQFKASWHWPVEYLKIWLCGPEAFVVGNKCGLSQSFHICCWAFVIHQMIL